MGGDIDDIVAVVEPCFVEENENEDRECGDNGDGDVVCREGKEDEKCNRSRDQWGDKTEHEEEGVTRDDMKDMFTLKEAGTSFDRW